MSELQQGICVLPYRQKLGLRPSLTLLRDLHWPLGMPDGFDQKTLGDLTENDHLLTPPASHVFLRPSFGTRAKVSVFLMEPRAVHKKYMTLLQIFHKRFHRVLTADEQLLRTIPNAKFFPIGGAWVKNFEDLGPAKNKMCSLIASEKSKLPGHILRHDVVSWVRSAGKDVDIMGRGYRPFSEKSEGLAPFRFSVVIENSREKNYFTEKLIDAMLCKVVPIYWGCPNIGDFFDTRGIVQCSNLDELQSAVSRMSALDYQSRKEAMALNFASAMQYRDIYERAARTIADPD